MKRAHWAAAARLLKENLPLAEKNWELWWNLAWCYFKLGQLDHACAHMIRAAKLAPANATCKFGLGQIYLERNEFKKAVSNCTESLRIKEAYVPRLALALAYMELGKATEAENTHLEGIRLKPKEARRYEAYADFLEDMGRDKQSRAMRRTAKKIARVFSAKI